MATYATAAAVKLATRDTNLAAETDAFIDILIEEAEVYIDAYAGYWQKYTKAQALLFPRLEDVNTAGDTFIPVPIIRATIAQCESIYMHSPDSDHGIKEDGSINPMVISPRAKTIMKGYISRIGTQVFSKYGDFDAERFLKYQ